MYVTKLMQERGRVMDSYVIRIYRREQEATGKMLGIVVGVDAGGDRPFSSAEELWHILENNQNSVGEHTHHRGGHHGKRE